ncbi:MAG: carboxypeptidase-like regulatory domain-containing protein [Candidatus Micrarchaeia archaeon]
MKKIILALALILLAGCLIFPPENKYELFSYLPSEGATNALFIDAKEEGFSELSSLLGVVMGGAKLKEIKGMQFALLGYGDGGSAGVIRLKTDMDVNELIRMLPYGEMEFRNETKFIGGKEVILLYPKYIYSEYDRNKENPLCMWREGEWLSFLYCQPGYRYVMDSMTKISSNDNFRCDVILEQKYDTKKAEELLSESTAMKQKLSAGGTLFGEAVGYVENQSIYVSVFGDEKADYGVVISKGGRRGASLCYNDSSSKSAEIVRRGSREACVKEYEGGSSSTLPSLSRMSFIYAERRVGDYSVVAITYPKESKQAVRSSVENIVFGTELGGEEGRWTDKMNLTVRVYERVGSQNIPVGDAKVELYSYSYPGYGYEYVDVVDGVSRRKLVKTAYTDNNGVAKFENLEVASYTVEVSKQGYVKGTDYVYAGETNSTVSLQKMGPLVVTVKESGGTPIAEATVRLYNRTLSYDYELIRTAYTNEMGVADFGMLEIDYGRAVVSKEGYKNYTAYVSSSSRNITVYLTKEVRYNYTGQPFTVTVRSYDSEELMINVEEAKVSIYNKTPPGYVLASTNYTNSNGVAVLKGDGIGDGKIEVEKAGYEKYSQEFYYYNGRNMVVYLTALGSKQTHGWDKILTSENCSGNFSVRIWPSEAATASCTTSTGAVLSSTGVNSADWFNYGGCGGWKRYNVTPGSQVKIHGYTDSCAGCTLWHINYYLHDYYNSTWHRVGYVDGPDERGATHDFCYTPKGSMISIEAETGFYVQVFTNQ